jgi:hypothetical protein
VPRAEGIFSSTQTHTVKAIENLLTHEMNSWRVRETRAGLVALQWNAVGPDGGMA